MKNAFNIRHSTLNIPRSLERLALPFLTAGIALLVWYAAVRFSGTKIFPSPLDVARAIGQLADQSLLWRYLGDSLARVACGYTLAVLLGVPLGIFLGSYPDARLPANPLIPILRPISPLA